MNESIAAGEDLSFVVAPDEAGLRIDQIVVRHLGTLGRRGTAELFRRGAVRCDGRVVRKGERVGPGRTVSVVHDVATPIRPEISAPLDVRLERADVVVVSKPAGQPTAPIRLGETGTLASALVGRYPELLGVGHQSREPGLLHRLDTQTSGLLVAARSVRVFEHLWQALTLGRLDKRYLAIVESDGLGESGMVEGALEPDPDDGRRVRLARPLESAGGASRPSITRWRRVRVAGRFAVVEATAAHAYRHQVRVHLASIGRPIAGDALYGGPSAPEFGARHALHASYVAWSGDGAVPGFAVEDPLPADLAALVRG